MTDSNGINQCSRGPHSSNENAIVQLSSSETPDALVQIVMIDNDSQAFVVTPSSLNVTEGASNTFQSVLIPTGFRHNCNLSVV